MKTSCRQCVCIALKKSWAIVDMETVPGPVKLQLGKYTHQIPLHHRIPLPVYCMITFTSSISPSQISLEESTTEKVCGLLRVTLSSLGRLLEVASMVEFGRLADEVLQYLKSVTSLLPTLTVQCGQQVSRQICRYVCGVCLVYLVVLFRV